MGKKPTIGIGAIMKKGGSINKTAGKTTTGVISDYKGYKGPKRKTQTAKVKKAGKF